MHNLPEGEYWRYLRKSRADLEAEARGEGETLAKHKRALERLAKQHNVLVTENFEEVASGESLFYRTEMLRMLDLMETRRPAGVLVMDMDRFGRGNMQEQGMIIDSFRRLGVLIVTPRKVYDLNNEFDEEYTEFEAFMARKELKIINRRLQGGRIRSVEEGNYVGTRPPYGYEITYTDRGERTLKPHPEQAEVIRLIFDLYVNGMMQDGELIEMGSVKISKALDGMNVPTYRENTKWNFNVILQILSNPVYIGRIQWKKQERTKTRNNERGYDYRKRSQDEIIDTEGKHEGIVNEEIFRNAQDKLKNKLVNPVKPKTKLVNPLSGVVKCGMCGSSMIYKVMKKNSFRMVCNNKYCTNRSSRFDFIEGKLIDILESWLKEYKLTWTKRDKKQPDTSFKVREQVIKTHQDELDQLKKQKQTLFDYLERKIYDEETFLERSANLSERIQKASELLENANKELEKEKNRVTAQNDIIPTIENVIKLYKRSKDPQIKNKLLKSIVLDVKYWKDKDKLGDDFTLEITPKIQ